MEAGDSRPPGKEGMGGLGRPGSAMEERNGGVAMAADMDRERSCPARSRLKAGPGSVLDDSEERRPEEVESGGWDILELRSTKVDEAGEVLRASVICEDATALEAVSTCNG